MMPKRRSLAMVNLQPQLTADGSYTFFSEAFQEHYHSLVGAVREAQGKFLDPCQIATLAQANAELVILDVCYGLGHNSAAALSEIWAVNPQCRVTLFALEQDSAVIHSSVQQGLLASWPTEVHSCLKQLSEAYTVQTKYLSAQLLLGDARQTIQQVRQSGQQAQAIFLDPFSPPKCPQLWTVEFIQELAYCLDPGGYLATYSCAAAVRHALLQAGLKIGSTPGVGRKSPGTLARYVNEQLKPLSLQEKEHLATNAAIPYRDPSLRAEAAGILRQREEEQRNSQRESTSRWKKRWQLESEKTIATTSTVTHPELDKP